MADATTPTPMDYNEHNRTYAGFLRFTSVALVWVLCIVVMLAIGGTAGAWILGGFWLVVATIASILGLAIKGLDWRPGAVIFVIMLATLAWVHA
jgi:hypothetical protein